MEAEGRCGLPSATTLHLIFLSQSLSLALQLAGSGTPTGQQAHQALLSLHPQFCDYWSPPPTGILFGCISNIINYPTPSMWGFMSYKVR